MSSNKKIVKVPIAGILYSGNEKYDLLKPEPVAKDSWQPDSVLRFFGVPHETEVKKVVGYDWQQVHDFPRHIVVSGTWHIDYGFNGKEIWITSYDQDETYISNVEEPFRDKDYQVVDPKDGAVYKYAELELTMNRAQK